MALDDDDFPEDPDLDSVPEPLRALASLEPGSVVLLSSDGVSTPTLAIAPGVFGHARRLKEDE